MSDGKKRIDATLNVTLEISNSEWEAFRSEDDQEDDEVALEAANYCLGSEEWPVVGGRVWVCSVDEAGLIE